MRLILAKSGSDIALEACDISSRGSNFAFDIRDYKVVDVNGI